MRSSQEMTRVYEVEIRRREVVSAFKQGEIYRDDILVPI